MTLVVMESTLEYQPFDIGILILSVEDRRQC